MSEDAAAKNTDRELWREREGDYYAPSLFVTEGGGIGIDVGGTVVVKPIRDWHALACAHPQTGIVEPKGYVGPPLPPRPPGNRVA